MSSRHYYDTFCMCKKGVEMRRDLLDYVIKTNMMPLQRRTWARHQYMNEHIDVIPAAHIAHSLANDYEKFKSRIHGTVPSWNSIIKELGALQKIL